MQAGVPQALHDWTIIVPATQIVAVAQRLRDASDARFDYLSDLTAVDWPPRAQARFDVVYCLYSTRLRHRVRLKVRVSEKDPLPSVTGVWPAANWLEREVWDMALGLSLIAFWQLLGLPADARAYDVNVADWIPRIPLATHVGPRRALEGLGAAAISHVVARHGSRPVDRLRQRSFQERW